MIVRQGYFVVVAKSPSAGRRGLQGAVRCRFGTPRLECSERPELRTHQGRIGSSTGPKVSRLAVSVRADCERHVSKGREHRRLSQTERTAAIPANLKAASTVAAVFLAVAAGTVAVRNVVDAQALDSPSSEGCR